MISETKLDERLPTSQFFMNGFSSPHRLDHNCNGGGILLYIREDIPSNLLSIERDLTEAYITLTNGDILRLRLMAFNHMAVAAKPI